MEFFVVYRESMKELKKKKKKKTSFSSFLAPKNSLGLFFRAKKSEKCFLRF
jgi:hypothetical protein